jgi:hypothetical protein
LILKNGKNARIDASAGSESRSLPNRAQRIVDVLHRTIHSHDFHFRPESAAGYHTRRSRSVKEWSNGVEEATGKMETKQKMAIAGSGLVVASIGLGIVGAALIVPAVFAWTARLVEKSADGLTARVEGASKTVGTVAGTLHRSFNEAKKAGVAELRRGLSEERSVAR